MRSAHGRAGVSPDSPYLWNLDFTLPIETAGKRGYRVLEAQRLTEASRLALAETAWQVRMKVRAALLEYLISERLVALHNTQLALGALENAIQRPLTQQADVPIVSHQPARNES